MPVNAVKETKESPPVADNSVPSVTKGVKFAVRLLQPLLTTACSLLCKSKKTHQSVKKLSTEVSEKLDDRNIESGFH